MPDTEPIQPNTARKLRVFLCHADRDTPTVRHIYTNLKRDETEPWFDKEDLEPGEEWERTIRAAVRRSDVVLVCMSSHSVRKSGFLQKEIRLALDVAQEKIEGEIFVIPVKLDECEPPEDIRKWQWVDWTSDNAYERLMRVLQRKARQNDLRIPEIRASASSDTPIVSANIDRKPVDVATDVRNKAVAILSPHMQDASARSAIIYCAFGDHSIFRQIVFDGSAYTFTENLVRQLISYGEFSPGEQALWTLLVTVRELVGVNKQAEIDELEPLLNRKPVTLAQVQSTPTRRKPSVTRVWTTATLILPSVTPDTARVFVDNEEHAAGEIELEMQEEERVIEVRIESDGHFPERFQADLIRGERTEFEPITLRKKPVKVVEPPVSSRIVKQLEPNDRKIERISVGENTYTFSKQAESTRINPKDNAEMIHIPAGDFLMGDDDQSDNPRRTVTLSGYYIYKNPVTVAEYRAFCADVNGMHTMPKEPPWGWQD